MTLTPSGRRYSLLYYDQDLGVLRVTLKASSLLISDLCHQEVALKT